MRIHRYHLWNSRSKYFLQYAALRKSPSSPSAMTDRLYMPGKNHLLHNRPDRIWHLSPICIIAPYLPEAAIQHSNNIFVLFLHAQSLYIEIYGFPYLTAALQATDSTSLLWPFLLRLHNGLYRTDILVKDFFEPCQLLWNPLYLYTSVLLPAYRLSQHTVCSNSSFANESPPELPF